MSTIPLSHTNHNSNRNRGNAVIEARQLITSIRDLVTGRRCLALFVHDFTKLDSLSDEAAVELADKLVAYYRDNFHNLL